MTTEITLSTDINIITAEINSYKQVAGQAIFEIGRRLKHVRDEKLSEKRGGWTEWLKEVDIDDSQARRFIIVVNELGEEYRGTYHALGLRALYEISTIPEEERAQPHTIPSTGETKTVDEMTVRELREVKAELKRKEEELERERQAKQAALDTLESMQDQEPKVVEVVKEIIPETVKTEMENLKNRLQSEQFESKKIEEKLLKLSIEKSEYESRLRKIEEYQKSEQFEIDRMRKEKEKLELQAHISISSLQIGIHKFIEEYSPNVFLQGAVAASAGIIKDDLLDSVIALEEFTEKLREILNAKLDRREIIQIN